MNNQRLQNILEMSDEFTQVPFIGIIADTDFTNLGSDPRLSKDEVIAELFGYLKLNEQLGIPLDEQTARMLESLGAIVEVRNGELILTLES